MRVRQSGAGLESARLYTNSRRRGKAHAMTANAPGRPSAGAQMKQQMQAAAQRRERQRDLKPLGRLRPFIGAHMPDAVAALLALLVSTAASLALTAAARLVIDRGFGNGGAA